VLTKEIQTRRNKSANVGFVVGSAYDTFIERTRVVRSQFDMLSLEDTPNSVIINFGGIVGYGQEIFLMNSQYGELNSLDVMFSWADYYTSGSFDVNIEYIGGIAGYLDDYTLLAVENHATVAAQSTVRGNLNNNSIAGVLGYSSRQGFIYEAANYGQVLGNYGVAGILGGVGFNQQFGNIYMDKVANYGAIYGWEGVSGIVGSLDGLTAITIRNALQTGYIMGYGAVGGVIGDLLLMGGVSATIENSIVQGEIYGIYDLGGVVGAYNNFSQNFSLLTLNRVLMLAEVWNMALGFVIFNELVLDFDSISNLVPFFALPYTGLIIGARYAPAMFHHVLAYQPELEQGLFEADFDAPSFTYSGETITGSFNPVGYGQGLGVVLLNGGIDNIDNEFMRSFFGNSTPWMTVTSDLGVGDWSCWDF
jgi:hypothetical protein